MVRPRLSASRSVRASAVAWALAAAACSAATPAQAHGFGQRYELPLPLSLYLIGAAAAVALSFVVFGLFVRRAPAPRTRPQIDLLATPLGRMVGHPAVVLTLRLAVLGLFVVTVLAGLLGDQNPYRNIAPTLVWIVWWVGLAYVAAFAGDIWALVNPWRTAFDGAQWLYRRLGGRGELGGRPALPGSAGRLARLPAAARLLLDRARLSQRGRPRAHRRPGDRLFRAHLGRHARLRPRRLAATRRGLLAGVRHLRPLRADRSNGAAGCCCARSARGLLDGGPVSTSMMAFVLLLLATVLYDGLIGTGEWALLEGALRARLPGLGELGAMLIKSVGLVAFWLLFLGAFIGICAVMSRVASGRPAPLEVARSFALTLIPIAIGYHVAHYLVFLLVQGQYIIPLLSDPFGRGWNLFGTAGYRVDIALAGARFAWYTAVAAIVTGHVLAVYLAHVRAMGVFAPARVALATQVPLTALMVVYTFIGLSITAEPIVESRAAAEPTAVASETVAIPADAVLPEAGSGRLQPVGPDRAARLKLTYKVLGSAFHDGTKTSAADLLYAYAFAYRWGARGNGEPAHYDPYIDAATLPLRRHLLGVRIAGVDAASKSFRVGDVNFVREVFTVEVYLDVAPEEPEWSAVVAPPWSTLPWHVLALMEQAVERGWAAFSDEEARRRGVAWLDLVRSQELGAKLAALVAEFERDGYRPQALARVRHRRRGAQALGGALGLPQGARPFPGDQRALQAQELVGGQRHAGGVPRPHLSAGRGLLRRLRHPAARLRHGHAMGGRPPRRSPATSRSSTSSSAATGWCARR